MIDTAKESITLPVLGMSCAACQQYVETALRATPGVQTARVDLMAHRASVVFDPSIAAPQALVDAIRAVGYDAVLPRAGDSELQSHTDASVGKSELKAWST
ncbi:MAG TPA: heavy metal-associated domain-containing protein, partial [Candidatus Sulfopaludibacter sp.]|nr:heavy metal-associated domain-containing protein [Candidatus Sulfopaludibacter sp.]